MLEQALEIEIATLGPVHPLIAITISMLAHHYIRQDDADTAELLVRQSLEMDRQIYDDAHRRVAGGLDTLGWIRWLSSSADPERNGSALREAVFDPIVRAAPGCQRLFIAPDGSFNRLPFEALPAPPDEFASRA